MVSKRIALQDDDRRTAEQGVIRWLPTSDPAIRRQVMYDLTGEPEEIVIAERARVATEGWGARLLARQRPDGQWGDDEAIGNIVRRRHQDGDGHAIPPTATRSG